MLCPHCAGEVTLAIGEEPIPASPADVEIARVQADRDIQLALINSGVNPGKPAETLPTPAPAETYAAAEVAVAAEEASAEVAAAEVMGDAIEGAAAVVAASVEAAAEIASDDDDDDDGEHSPALDDEIVVESSDEESAGDAAPSHASRWGFV